MVTSNGGIEYRSNQNYTVIILGGLLGSDTCLKS